jgi:hypothetical protein
MHARPRLCNRLVWVALATLAAIGADPASATENGASVYPAGVETVVPGIQPHPGKSTINEFTAYYAANELDNAQGKSSMPEFKLRVVATAIKVTHNWGWKALGGTVESVVALPLIYQQLHIPPGKFSRYSLGNVDMIPASVTYHRGDLHWFYEADFFLPGAAYNAADALNIGQHNLAAAPVLGFTYLPHKGATEVSSRLSYIVNGPDKATGYHSGNEFVWEYTLDRALARDKFAAGLNGDYCQQTTGDTLHGAAYDGGFKGRTLQVGPQVRFPMGKGGGFAFKYYRDTLVQNRPRGNAFWFQISVPVKLSRGHA